MRRLHEMPFGCLPLAAGGVRFRLWAPGARRIELRLEDAGGTLLAMERAQGGWWELEVAQARAGSRYGYRIDGGLVVPDPASRANPDDVQRSLAQLVLTLVDFLRQLLERQAIRRLEEGTLTPAETEAIGLALQRLERAIRSLARRFGLTPDDLKLDLGPLGRLT